MNNLLRTPFLDAEALKQAVVEAVKEVVQARIDAAQTAMQAAQASANEETKSSAGDKYETGRAMSQRDRDMFAQQLQQAQQEMALVARLSNTQHNPEIVTAGALVKTSDGYFWLGISAGKTEIEDKIIWAVSPQSPVGKLLMDRKVGDTMEWAGKKSRIEDIS